MASGSHPLEGEVFGRTDDAIMVVSQVDRHTRKKIGDITEVGRRRLSLAYKTAVHRKTKAA